MHRLVGSSGPLVTQWAKKNALLKKLQDNCFKSAMLAGKRLNPESSFEQLHQKILQMTLSEQRKYAENYHLECLFKHFSIFNQATQLKPTFIDISKSNVKDLVDPDKFPIWDLKAAKPKYQHVWDGLMGFVRHQLGFQLVVRESKVQHPQGGKGVKLILSSKRLHKQSWIQPGQFLGLLPGVVYQSQSTYQKYKVGKMNKYERKRESLIFPSGSVVQLDSIDLPTKSTRFLKSNGMEKKPRQDPSFLNPLALGHMINHPPPGEQENVCFLEVQFEKNFFPHYWLRYLPYQGLEGENTLILYGVFALKELRHNEQLFVNYQENYMYNETEYPQWYLKPDVYSSHYRLFEKKEYELPSNNYWYWFQRKTSDESTVEKGSLAPGRQFWFKFQSYLLGQNPSDKKNKNKKVKK